MYLLNIAKRAFGFGVIPKMASLINILLLPFITPFLTPFDYGIWGIVTSYSGIFIVIAPLGLNLFLTNGYYEYPNRWQIVWGRVMFYFYLSGFLLGLLYVCILLKILTEVNFSTRIGIVLLGSIPILFFGNNTLAQHLYPLKGTPGPLVYRNLLASILGVCVSFVSIYFFRIGFWGFLLGTAITAISGFLLFCPLLYMKEMIRPIVDKRLNRFSEMLKLSWPLIPHSLGFVLLSSSSRIIMSLYNVPISDIGLYSNGYMMGDYVTILTTSLVVALVPQMQESYRSGNMNKYRKLYYLCQLTTFMLVFCFSIWMPEIYRLFIRNESFQSCSYIASFICFANVLLPFYNFSSTIVFIKKDSQKLLWLIFVPGVVNILLSVLLIPLFGYMAAVYTSLLAYWTIPLIPFISRYYQMNTLQWLGRRRKIALLFLMLVLLLIVSRVIMDLNIVIKILSSLSCLLCYMYILQKGQFKKIFVC